MPRRLIALLLLLLCKAAIAQENESESFAPKLRAAVMMLNSHIPQATNGEKKIAITPGCGFDVDYIFHRRWSATLQTDVKLQSFEVEEDNADLQRSYPFSMAVFFIFFRLNAGRFIPVRDLK